MSASVRLAPLGGNISFCASFYGRMEVGEGKKERERR